MHIDQIFAQHSTTFSFEFFPPKTEAASQKLFQSIKELLPLDPAFVSVTYGAGGTTRQLTRDLVQRIHSETELTVIPHLTCVGSTRGEIDQILDDYYSIGIRNILALAGDPPLDEANYTPPKDGFPHAADLVRFIRETYPDMGIGVAGFPEGHPSTPNRLLEIDYLKEKVDAGANYICTQLFYDNRDFYDFRDRCKLAGINIPIIAGIMPISSKKGMKRMAELALGCRFPAPLLKSIARAENDTMVSNVGIHWATEQVRDLINNKVDGIHFYTLNHSTATLEIYKSLGVTNSSQLEF